MSTSQKERHGSLEVHRDYVYLPLQVPNLDWVTDAPGTPVTDMGHEPITTPSVSDRRLTQELLSASLRSSGSAFIFSTASRVACIEETQAHLGDDAALAALLASLPLAALVGPLLHKPFFGRKWDSTKQSDHWLASDGATILSVMISGASAAAVARMRTRFDDMRIASPGLLPSHGILRDLLEEIAREDGQAADVSTDG